MDVELGQLLFRESVVFCTKKASFSLRNVEEIAQIIDFLLDNLFRIYDWDWLNNRFRVEFLLADRRIWVDHFIRILMAEL